jgi:hypothetical protein
MAEQKLYRVELRVTKTLHLDVTANTEDEAKKLARARVEKEEYGPEAVHKAKIRIVAVDELALEADAKVV